MSCPTELIPAAAKTSGTRQHPSPSVGLAEMLRSGLHVTGVAGVGGPVSPLWFGLIRGAERTATPDVEAPLWPVYYVTAAFQQLGAAPGADDELVRTFASSLYELTSHIASGTLPMPPEFEELGRQVLRSLDARREENLDEWAARLVRDIADATD